MNTTNETAEKPQQWANRMIDRLWDGMKGTEHHGVGCCAKALAEVEEELASVKAQADRAATLEADNQKYRAAKAAAMNTSTMRKPKPKTQTLWAVVHDATGEIVYVTATRGIAVGYVRGVTQFYSVRRLTVPAFAPKPKRKERKP